MFCCCCCSYLFSIHFSAQVPQNKPICYTRKQSAKCSSLPLLLPQRNWILVSSMLVLENSEKENIYQLFYLCVGTIRHWKCVLSNASNIPEMDVISILHKGKLTRYSNWVSSQLVGNSVMRFFKVHMSPVHQSTSIRCISSLHALLHTFTFEQEKAIYQLAKHSYVGTCVHSW